MEKSSADAYLHLKPEGANIFDKVGIWLSSACLLHCLLTPVVLLLLPVASFANGEWVHTGLACVLPLIALLAFVPGFRRHRSRRVIAFGIAGLSFILFAAIDPFRIFSSLTESAVTSLGSFFLISAHLRNRSLCTHCDGIPHD